MSSIGLKSYRINGVLLRCHLCITRKIKQVKHQKKRFINETATLIIHVFYVYIIMKTETTFSFDATTLDAYWIISELN